MRLLPQDYLNFYMQPIYARRQMGSPWFNWILLGLTFIVPCSIGLTIGQWSLAIGFGASVPAFFLIFMWWLYFINSAMLQNSPRNTCLTPHLRRRLIQATILLWFGCSASFSIILGSIAGHFVRIFEITGFILIFSQWHLPRGLSFPSRR